MMRQMCDLKPKINAFVTTVHDLVGNTLLSLIAIKNEAETLLMFKRMNGIYDYCKRIYMLVLVYDFSKDSQALCGLVDQKILQQKALVCSSSSQMKLWDAQSA